MPDPTRGLFERMELHKRRRAVRHYLADYGRSLGTKASLIKQRNRNLIQAHLDQAQRSLTENGFTVSFADTPSEACRLIAEQTGGSAVLGGFPQGLSEITHMALQREGVSLKPDSEWVLSGAVAVAAQEGAIVLPILEDVPESFHLIIVTGTEKLTANLDEALVILEAWARFGTGSHLPQRSWVLHGPMATMPTSTPEPEQTPVPVSGKKGIRSATVIWIDNGRKSLSATYVAPALDCIDCGACSDFCPVHFELGNAFGGSMQSGRGTSLAGLLEEQPVDAIGGNWVDCLQCEACLPYCPTGIDIAGLNRHRGMAADPGDLGPLRLAWIRLTGKRKSMTRRMFFSNLPLTRRVARTRIARRWTPALPLEQDRLWQPAVRPLHKSLPVHWVPLHGNARLKVAYFSDCLGHFFYPQIGMNAHRLLGALGAEIHFPHSHGCCGAPAYFAGQIQACAQSLLNVLHDFATWPCDRVVTTSPLCAQVLRRAPEILARSGLSVTEQQRRQAEDLAAMVRDASQVMIEDLEAETYLQEQPVQRANTVMLLPSCHQSSDTTASQQQLLASLPGVTPLPYLHEFGCCGFGGFHAFDRHETSLAIGRRPLEKLKESGATYLLTSCTGCLMHLLDTQHHQSPAEREGQVAHLLEFAGSCLRRKTR